MFIASSSSSLIAGPVRGGGGVKLIMVDTDGRVEDLLPIF